MQTYISNSGTKTAEKAAGPFLQAGALVPFLLVTALFFLWGIPNNLNDVLIRQFMKSFALGRMQAGLVQSAFYLGYFTIAIPAALVMRKAGYKAGMIVGLLLFGTGAALFLPAAYLDRYGFFLFALFVIASGLSFLETASNPFIAQLGDPARSEQRLNFSQAFNPLGAISGVICGTIFVFSGVEPTTAQIAAMKAAGTYQAFLKSETIRVVNPYLVLAGIAFLWAILIAFTKFPTLAGEEEEGSDTLSDQFRTLTRKPQFLLAILAQFLYVGAQVGTWSYFIQYIQEYAHFPEKAAGYYLSGTLGAFLVGRSGSAYLMRYVRPSLLMAIYSVMNMGLLCVAVLHPGKIGVWCIFVTSLFMSVMYPTIFAVGIKGLGPATKLGGSLLVMSIVGGAILTPLMGLLSEQGHGVALAYIVPFFCYLFVGLYGFRSLKQSAAEQKA